LMFGLLADQVHGRLGDGLVAHVGAVSQALVVDDLDVGPALAPVQGMQVAGSVAGTGDELGVVGARVRGERRLRVDVLGEPAVDLSSFES
jgi:hypothetical protein